MGPQVKQIEPMPNYRLKVRFENDEAKEFDATPLLDKGIFRELKDENYFKQVRVALGWVEWPHEQDFSKDTLYLLGALFDN